MNLTQFGDVRYSADYQETLTWHPITHFNFMPIPKLWSISFYIFFPNSSSWLLKPNFRFFWPLSSSHQQIASTSNNPADKCTICLNALQDRTKMKPCEHVFCRVCICTWVLRLYQAEQESGAPTALTCPICRQNPSHIETSGPYEVISLKSLSYHPQNSSSTGWERWGWLLSQLIMWSGTWSTGYHERAAAASFLASQQIPR